MDGLINGLKIVVAILLVLGFTLAAYIFQWHSRSPLHIWLYFVSILALGFAVSKLLGWRFGEESTDHSDTSG